MFELSSQTNSLSALVLPPAALYQGEQSFLELDLVLTLVVHLRDAAVDDSLEDVEELGEGFLALRLERSDLVSDLRQVLQVGLSQSANVRQIVFVDLLLFPPDLRERRLELSVLLSNFVFCVLLLLLQ